MNFDPLCHEHICRRHPFDLECSACGETIVGNDPWDQRIKHVAEHFTTMANNVDHERLLTLWAYNERLMIYVGHNIYRPTSWHDIKDLMVRERRGYDEIPNRYQSRVDLSSKEELTFQFTEKKNLPGTVEMTMPQIIIWTRLCLVENPPLNPMSN